jgi:hypothetical protein
LPLDAAKVWAEVHKNLAQLTEDQIMDIVICVEEEMARTASTHRKKNLERAIQPLQSSLRLLSMARAGEGMV